MQQRHHVVVLTSCDGLDFFSTSHEETQAAYTKQHGLALALGGVWDHFWDGTKAVTIIDGPTLGSSLDLKLRLRALLFACVHELVVSITEWQMKPEK